MTARTAYGVFAALALLATAGPARAHDVGLSRGDYTPDGSRVRAVLSMRADDAMAAAPGLDADADGVLSDDEIDRGSALLKGALLDSMLVMGDGARCRPSLDEAGSVPPDGLGIRGTFACEHAPSRLSLRFGFLERLSGDHRHLATVHLARGDVDSLAVLARPVVDVEVAAGVVHRSRPMLATILGGVVVLAWAVCLGRAAGRRRTRGAGAIPRPDLLAPSPAPHAGRRSRGRTAP